MRVCGNVPGRAAHFHLRCGRGRMALELIPVARAVHSADAQSHSSLLSENSQNAHGLADLAVVLKIELTFGSD